MLNNWYIIGMWVVWRKKIDLEGNVIFKIKNIRYKI